ncbi:MAG: ATP-binding protein [Actinomycetota bacterium]|nr:ATP-binding protein [Actinomycetota bacterium]
MSGSNDALRVTQSEEVSIELPSKPEFVRTGRLVVAAVARHHEFGDEQVEDLKIAVSEALTNSVRAHLDAGVSDPVHIRLALVEDALVIEVRDRGRGFNPDEVPVIGATPLPGSLENGLGLMLIRSLITDTVIERSADSGMLIRMTLKREVEPAEV